MQLSRRQQLLLALLQLACCVPIVSGEENPFAGTVISEIYSEEDLTPPWKDWSWNSFIKYNAVNYALPVEAQQQYIDSWQNGQARLRCLRQVSLLSSLH
eukprot:scaffold205_cov407-Prasinococcus_capsulatus_cf.AAC.9